MAPVLDCSRDGFGPIGCHDLQPVTRLRYRPQKQENCLPGAPCGSPVVSLCMDVYSHLCIDFSLGFPRTGSRMYLVGPGSPGNCVWLFVCKTLYQSCASLARSGAGDRSRRSMDRCARKPGSTYPVADSGCHV